MEKTDHMKNWFGLGVKGGGILGFGGFETLECVLTNLGFPRHQHSMNISSLRVGFGLGAGVGATAVFVYNCGNLQNLHETKCEDWSLNISYGPKWKEIAKMLMNLKFFSKAAIAAKAGKFALGDIETFRNAASYLYTSYDMVANKPQIVSIDIPFVGVGLEGSIQKLYGEILIGDLIDAGDSAPAPAPTGVRRGTI